MTVVRRVFIGTGMAHCYYTGAPGDSHLRNTWPSCSMLEVVPRPMHAWIVGWSFPLLRVSGEELALEVDLMFVSVSSVDKDAEKTFDSCKRMHMIWRDRV